MHGKQMCFYGKLSTFAVAFYMLDRVLAGFIQCPTLGCLPW